ncbi:MAG: hypothetical protein KF726_22695 [Anaerolineae bacterium]|nr:hypothetical protein [Anaerolineae bacterium]
MYRRLVILLVVVVVTLSTVGSPQYSVEAQANDCPQEIKTANPNASPAASRVLSYLWGLQFRDDKRVVAGQFGSYGDGADVPAAEARLQKVFDQSGKYPAMTGMDYRNWDSLHGNNLSIPNKFLIAQWNKGSLITISWHANNPWTGGPSTDWEYPAGSGQVRSVRELTQTGSDANKRWLEMLDNIASGLEELQQAGVVAIWRPLHEMNGGWFWWNLQSPEDYRLLWQHMYNYFTQEKGLNNLLWGYSPNTNNNEYNKRTDYFYPGDGYVDVVGLDKYRELEEDPLELDAWKEYSDLVSKCKPMGLFEFGATPANSQADRPKYDFRKLIRDIKSKYPKIVFFQAWEWHWAIGEHLSARQLFSDPWVIALEDLPNFREG